MHLPDRQDIAVYALALCSLLCAITFGILAGIGREIPPALAALAGAAVTGLSQTALRTTPGNGPRPSRGPEAPSGVSVAQHDPASVAAIVRGTGSTRG